MAAGRAAPSRRPRLVDPPDAPSAGSRPPARTGVSRRRAGRPARGRRAARSALRRDGSAEGLGQRRRFGGAALIDQQHRLVGAGDGGSGDVLAGWIGGMWAQSPEVSPHDLATAAVAWHGAAAEGHAGPMLAADLVAAMAALHARAA
ncbi:hypothetical protein FUT87_25255 [Mitsuaria sp. TWR114]|nr:hypothetical protein FUT87_25255 [Mitsuaria sp. TWR114]